MSEQVAAALVGMGRTAVSVVAPVAVVLVVNADTFVGEDACNASA